MKTIYVCYGTGCKAGGGGPISDKFAALCKDGEVLVKRTGCHGLCQEGPLVHISPDEITYTKVKVEDVEEIVEKTIRNSETVDRLLYIDKAQKKRVKSKKDWSFCSKQKRVVLREVGEIDPQKIEDYLEAGGYRALSKAILMGSEQILQEVNDSGLRGRGGGGFATGRKWNSVAKAKGEQKYVLCNGDEGDPGAFMDRSIMEGNPHLVLEGMAIASIAVGASRGYVYVRNEYPMAVEHLQMAIDSAEAKGYLGKNILGSGLNLKIEIKRGAGAFVCGESSALMRSIEGKIGQPNEKHIHASDKGVFESPTLLNNVETYANIPTIILEGGKTYAKTGTEKSPGTKVFSLVGKVVNTGLIEVEMGVTLRDIIFDIGGGIKNDRKFKAVQTGGPSGGCLTEDHLDVKIDFDTLVTYGSMMGSGGMIIMDEFDCMVEVARYFTGFLIEESCGRCTPCRDGLLQVYKILDRITKGEGKMEDLDTLEEFGEYLESSALCGLGKSAANPFLSTLKYFKHEFVEHIEQKFCRAGVCKELTTFEIDEEKCKSCGMCAKVCSFDAIQVNDKKYSIDQSKCMKCRACLEACKFGAVSIKGRQ